MRNARRLRIQASAAASARVLMLFARICSKSGFWRLPASCGSWLPSPADALRRPSLVPSVPRIATVFTGTLDVFAGCLEPQSFCPLDGISCGFSLLWTHRDFRVLETLVPCSWCFSFLPSVCVWYPLVALLHECECQSSSRIGPTKKTNPWFLPGKHKFPPDLCHHGHASRAKDRRSEAFWGCKKCWPSGVQDPLTDFGVIMLWVFQYPTKILIKHIILWEAYVRIYKEP